MALCQARAAEQATLGQHISARMAFPSNLQQLSGPSQWHDGHFPKAVLAHHDFAAIANEAGLTPTDHWPYPGQRRSEVRGRLPL